jgi:hypothetical protein
MGHLGVLGPGRLRDRSPFPLRSRRTIRGLLLQAGALLLVAMVLFCWTGWIDAPPANAAKAWIRYPIRTGGWNGYHRIHGDHVVYAGQVGTDRVAFLYDIKTETTSQITSPVYEGFIEYLDIQGNWVVIQAHRDSQSDIFLYDIAGDTLTNLTKTSGLDEEHPSISSGRIVWTGFDGNDWELFMYDTANSQTAQLTNNAVDDLEPVIDGNWVACAAYRSVANPTTDVSLKWVGLPAGPGSRFLTYTDAGVSDIQVRGNFMTWYSYSGGTHLYDIALGKTTNLSQTYGAHNPSMDNGRVVWEYFDGNDNEIVVYELASGATTQLTNNSFDDNVPRVTGNEVVWSADSVKGESNVYYCDLGQPGYGPPEGVLINDALGANTLPEVSAGKVVWTRYRDYPNSDVFLAEKVDITPVPIDPGDNTPPVISAVQAGSITAGGATITWNTDEAATSQVEYGPTTSYGSSTTLNSGLTQSHSQTITGLTPNTLYHFRARSRDAAGNPAVSADAYFTTLPPLPPQGTTFSDVPANHPYAPAINGLRGAGAISGYGDNTFRPENHLWRAQFAKMIVEALSLTDAQGQPVSESLVAPFTDLGPDDPTTLYPHDYIALIAQRGVTVGKTPTTFAPWDNVSRAQVISMVVRAAHEAGGLPAAPPPGYQSALGDFSPSHAENARIAEYNGLTAGLVGYGAAWDPWASATRGECAQIIWNLYQKGFGPGP